ncbi:hypothetical protein EJ04DRAFT_177266 [Polyplosphaeria fusca]|uniref:Uncharacterized protein n=1 Tax=Polyplosphaeria fusca TaxID=682080 RepID=A0A9P4R382_9PLEO|nr:hypothetical protein EJ04DRAFT_177266 [Polyplosphaeria fusca]
MYERNATQRPRPPFPEPKISPPHMAAPQTHPAQHSPPHTRVTRHDQATALTPAKLRSDRAVLWVTRCVCVCVCVCGVMVVVRKVHSLDATRLIFMVWAGERIELVRLWTSGRSTI